MRTARLWSIDYPAETCSESGLHRHGFVVSYYQFSLFLKKMQMTGGTGNVSDDFLQFMKNQPIVLFDGAMGTELVGRGVEAGGLANLSHPEEVAAIHARYVEAGAMVLITNTLTMNRLYMETHGVSASVSEANRKGAELARRAADTKGYGWVLGVISSTGQLLEPYGEYSETTFYETFKEQASILAEAGVDGFIIETIIDLREALCALKACRDAAANLPVIVSLSFNTVNNGCRTIMGNTAVELAQAATAAGAVAVGANCGALDPGEMAAVAANLSLATDLPVIIQPNAGKPILVEEQTIFEMSPQTFQEGITECIRAGARLVGGCCGTTPDHIRAVARWLDTEYQY